MKNIFILISIFLFTLNIQAQQKDTITKPQVAVIARAQKDGKIMLRWSATTPRAWRKSNQYGYQLKRYTILRDKQALSNREEKDFGVFKPKPVEDWMKLIETNDNAAIIAQSIYGEGFDVEGMDRLTAIVNMSEEQQQRFTWALYAADQNFEAAKMAGLGFVDTTVKPNEKYLYKVTPLTPKDIIDIEDGGVFIGLQDYKELPKPMDLAVIFSDKKTMLSWNYAILNKTYNSYFVERSKDSINFKQLNKLPITSLNNNKRRNSKRMFYLDSIDNDKSYYYRIRGRNAFGEVGPASKIVFGISRKALEYMPKITNKNYFGTSGIVLEWEFPKEGNKQITGFELNRSDKATGKYKVIKRNIPPESRKIKYDSLQPTNYLTITAIGKNGTRKTSLSALVQPVDSIPPVKPIGFEGKVDSLGIVTLKWIANKEKDMLGYRIFRGNNLNEEYSQITVSPHQATVYYDSISIKNLNSKVYYKLVAVDKRFNVSKSSDILTLKKPDIIPPTQAVFKTYKITKEGVNLTWVNSSSKDVVKHEVYRKENNSSDWLLVHTINKEEEENNNEAAVQPTNNNEKSNWIDSNITEGYQYTYTVMAIDDSNLKSKPSKPLTVVIPVTSLKPAIKRFTSFVDKKNAYIELFWKQYKEPNVAELMIYKGIKDKKITLLKNVLPNTKSIIDTQIKPNNEYVYLIRAIFKDGSKNKASQIIVKY
ncbi:MAG TPA: hypothetical protein EYG92_09665 [Lutibacter sp.]|nr:hypothetical protein [Lutibacter sp.]